MGCNNFGGFESTENTMGEQEITFTVPVTVTCRIFVGNNEENDSGCGCDNNRWNGNSCGSNRCGGCGCRR